MSKIQDQADKQWKLRGVSRQATLFVGAAFCAAAVLAAGVDLYSDSGWDSPTLQAWTLVPQIVAGAGLFLIGRRRASVAFYVLAALIGLIVVEEVFHVLNPVAARLAGVARWAQSWSELRLSVLNGVLIYGLVALAGIAMLVLSHSYGSAVERPVVRNVALFLLAAGFFGGPIGMVSTMGYRPRWIFVEEFGEAMVFAVLAAYVVGLAIRTGVVLVPRFPRPTRP